MAEPYGSPSSSSSSPSERFPEEPFPELSESLEDQGVELEIIMRFQPLPSCPPPTSDIGSPTNFGSKSSDNTVQTLESSPTTNS